MKTFIKVLLTALFFTACGSQHDFKHSSDSYQVNQNQNLDAAGKVTLSFEQVSLSKNLAVTEAFTKKCAAFAADYTKASGVEVAPDSLHVTFSEPSKHCARRNAARQCETHQFIYNFSCEYQTK